MDGFCLYRFDCLFVYYIRCFVFVIELDVDDYVNVVVFFVIYFEIFGFIIVL